MRILIALLLFPILNPVSAQSKSSANVDPWQSHIGLMAGMNTSIMQMKGGFGPHETSGMQWSAEFGIYFKSQQKNMFRFEVQTGYETAGAGREYFYQRYTSEFVRIYDRYRTIPLTILLTRNFGWKETLSLGAGFKSSFVLNYATRHSSSVGQSGVNSFS
jgi:hypothetical protein